MRVQTIRASESLAKAGDKTLEADVRAALKDGDANVVIQSMLTLALQIRTSPSGDQESKTAAIAKVVEAAQAANKARGVKELGDLVARGPQLTGGGGGGFRLLGPEQRTAMEKGQGIYTELCFSCHAQDGQGEALLGAPAGTKMAPPIAGSTRVTAHKEYVIRTLLHGLTGPVDGSTYSNVMIPMGDNTDEWVASIASFIRNSFGNSASFVSPEDVARVRAKVKNHTAFWTVEELDAAVPTQIAPHAGWKATASVNQQAAPRAVAGLITLANGRPAPGLWSTAQRQQPGMWFMVDMSAPATITEIHFDSQASFAGQGGGGQRPAGAGGPAAGGPAAGGPPRPAGAGAPGGGPGGGGFGGPGGGLPPTVATFPRAYEVHVSLDGQKWGLPIASGKGASGSTTIVFEPVRARYVRITQTATDETAPAWTVARLQVYGPAMPAGAKPSAP